MSSKNSVSRTLLVALSLCVVCSIVVSGTAVLLKPQQDANKILDRNKNILSAAGLFDPDTDEDSRVDELFSRFTPRIVDLEADKFLSEQELSSLGLDPVSFDAREVLNDPQLSEAIPADDDVADIKRRSLYQTLYLVEEQGDLETIVLPISGYGLWGILWGYLALEGDGDTVKGLAFYELKETPGLGAEVRNPRWTALWPGKKVYGDDGEVALSVVKGAGQGEHEIDGLSGATLTSRGVDNLIEYWLGEQGFGPILSQLRTEYGG